MTYGGIRLGRLAPKFSRDGGKTRHSLVNQSHYHALGRLRVREDLGMDLGLRNATIAVTGGSSGMGRAAAECMADDGARVAILARGKEKLDETVAALLRRGSADAIGLTVDV